jgi:integrase
MGRRVTTIGTGSVYRRTNRAGVGLPTWHIQYSIHGKQHRESAKTTNRDTALELLKKRLGLVANGTHPDRDHAQVTVRQLLAALVQHYKDESMHSVGNVTSHAKVLNEAIGDWRALDVRTATLRRLVGEWRKARKTIATCNRRIQILRTAFNYGDVLVDPARLKFAKVIEEEKSARARYIDREAFAAIHKHLPDELQDAFELAYLVGKRRAQLLGTKWSFVNTSTWVIRWPADTTKTSKPESLKLAGRPLVIMRRRWKERDPDCDLVFHRDGKAMADPKKAWGRACKAAGYVAGRKGLEWRATRHSAMTNLLNAGVPIHEAMLITGHRTQSVVNRYSLGIEAQQAKALEAVTAAHPGR